MLRPVARLAATLGLLALVGCANAPKPLYHWESFPRQQYSVLLREGVSPDEQIRVLEAQAEKARVGNAALPPGLRAHLGMLYLGAGNPQRAKELWIAEKTAFPEASPYMDRLLRRLEPSTSPAKTENPA
jgi:hypothetical protein